MEKQKYGLPGSKIMDFFFLYGYLYKNKLVTFKKNTSIMVSGNKEGCHQQTRNFEEFLKE